MKRLRTLLTADDGISMVEMLIASAISLVILTGVLQLLDSGVRVERAQDARHQAMLELRGAMGRVSKELRQATSLNATSSTPTRLEIRTLINGTERHVVYDVADGRLNRYLDGGSAVVIAEGLRAIEPFCYDPPSCHLESPTPLPTSVRISLSVSPDVFSSEPITLETEVELRNM